MGKRFLIAVLAIGAFLGYLVLQWWGLLHAWGVQIPAPTPRAEQFSSGLGGLVGGIVAAFFGQKVPPNPPGIAPSEATLVQRTLQRATMAGTVLSAADPGTPPPADPRMRSTLGWIYALGYLVTGFGTIAAAASITAPTSTIENNAVVFFGLFSAILTSALKD